MYGGNTKTIAIPIYTVLPYCVISHMQCIMVSLAKCSKSLRELFVSKYRRQSNEDMELFQMAELLELMKKATLKALTASPLIDSADE